MARSKPQVWQLPIGQVAFQWEGNTQTLLIDGRPSSAINWQNPQQPVFNYLQWADQIGQQWVADYLPGNQMQNFTALHLGGAAASLPLAWSLRYPRSAQNVVEISSELVKLVRQEITYPKAARFKLRVADGAQVVATTRPGRWHLIVQDVFAAGQTPVVFTTEEYLRQIIVALAPCGLLLTNLTQGVNEQENRYRSLFAEVKKVEAIGGKGKRQTGNTLLVAATKKKDPMFWAACAARLIRCPAPGRLS